jgi:hypothetical protein
MFPAHLRDHNIPLVNQIGPCVAVFGALKVRKSVIVVSNSSPLIALARIGRLNLLASFYNRILIPAEVHHEVTVAGRGLPGAEEVRNAQWIEVASQKIPPHPSLKQACQNLGAGERGAILLAKSLPADLVLSWFSVKWSEAVFS